MNLLADDEPIGMIRLVDLRNILAALALTDCDRRTLGIVARATNLEAWFGPEQPAGQVVFIEQPKQLKRVDQ